MPFYCNIYIAILCFSECISQFVANLHDINKKYFIINELICTVKIMQKKRFKIFEFKRNKTKNKIKVRIVYRNKNNEIICVDLVKPK